MSKIIALVFDFDDTLVHDSTTDFLASFGVDTRKFWREDNRKLLDEGWDNVPAYMRQMIEWSKSQPPDKRITAKKLEAFAKKVHFFDGVQTLFPRLTDFAKKTDPAFTLEFYIISSGIREIVRNCKIAKYMNDIFTSEFHFNMEGEIECPKKVVSYTDKTRYIFQISKGFIGSEYYNKPFAVNRKVEPAALRIPLHNMIFIGDGLTDVPCFSLMNHNRGIAFAVYDKTCEEKKHNAWGFVEEGRVKNLHSTNYKNGSDLLNSIEMAIGGIMTKVKGAYQEQRMSISAGIILFTDSKIFLVHPGGPFFYNRDDGCWSIPKGILDDAEHPLEAALREFTEETGVTLDYPLSSYINIGEVNNKHYKTVKCFALRTQGQEKFISCNLFDLEWPKGSGQIMRFSECDRGEWFDFEQAVRKLTSYQVPLVERIQNLNPKLETENLKPPNRSSSLMDTNNTILTQRRKEQKT